MKTFCLSLALLGFVVASFGQTPPNPVPFVNQPLVPAAVAPGGPGLTLTVNGTGFVPDSVVNWNGSPRPTTFVSSAQVTAAIPDTDIANPGTASITVVNPAPGGGASNVVFLPVTDPTTGVAMARSLYGGSTNPRAIVVGDFNGDGKLDLAAPYSTGVDTQVLAIWLGGGDGTFLLHSQVVVGYIVALATGDFNGDGHLDLAVQSAGTGPITIVLGNGDGTFQIRASYVLAPSSRPPMVGDFNGDGALDIAVGDPTGVSLFFGNGDGTFQTPVLIPLDSTTGQLVAGDFNGDGVLDLAAQGEMSTSIACHLLIGNGDGTFQPPMVIPFLGYWDWMVLNYVSGFAFTAADFNGDGTLDIAAGCDEAWVCVLPGNGDGTFQQEQLLSYTTLSFPTSIQVADFNGDGKLDFVVATTQSHGVCVMLARGDGTFGYNLFVPGGSGAWDISLGDFNGDGRIDLAVANGYSIAEFLQVPSLSFSPSGLSFSSQLVGTSSAPQSVTLTNSGVPLAISSITVAGTHSSSFTETNTCGTGLAPGANCAISVTFTPQVTGTLTADVSVSDNAPGSPQTIPLYGQSISAAEVTLSPTQLTFTSQLVGTTSPAQPVTVSNTGAGPLTIFGISTSPAVLSQTNNCGTFPATLAIGASCQIAVTFSPASAGTIWGALVITHDAAGSPHTVSLTGTGVAPVVILSPSSLSFGSQQVGTTSAAQAVTLSNAGTAPLTISLIQASGDFAQTNNCPLSPGQVAVGSGCTISVTFTPLAGGARAGSITIADDAPNSPQTISLSGTGTGVAATITLSTANLAFGNQNVGTTSAPLTVTVTNTGGGPATIFSISTSTEFAQTSNCPLSPATLAASASCTINVTFSPSAAGTRMGTLTITDNAPGSPHLVNLSGTGVGPGVSLSATTLHFADQPLGTTSAPDTVTLTNGGNAPLTISGITASGAYAESNDCVSPLAAGAHCTITVTFTPTVVGGQSGTLTIADGASGSPHTVALNGVGLGAVATLSATSLNFGNQTLGTTSAPKPVNLSNSGNAAMTITSIAASGDFAQTNNCPGSLTGESYCTISVTFTPTAAGSRTGALTITDNASGSPRTVTLAGTGSDFSLSSDPTSRTVTAGQSATYTLSVGPVSGFNQAVALTCTKPTQLTLATCSVSPSAATPDGTNSATVIVTVTTTARGMAPPFGGHRPPLQDPPLGRHTRLPLQVWLLALAMLAAVAAMSSSSQESGGEDAAGTGRDVPEERLRGRLTPASLLAASLLLALLWTACGGGGGGGGGGGNPGTPAGTYMLTITATTSNLSHSTTVELTVR